MYIRIGDVVVIIILFEGKEFIMFGEDVFFIISFMFDIVFE